MTAGPPFRAEHVGSLLRPAELHRTRAQARAGALSAGDLRVLEDRLIERAVAKQEAIGLHVVTDGEYRRDFWHLDFLRQLEGVGLAPIAGVKFHAEDVPPMPTVTGRVRCAGPIMAEDFQFLRIGGDGRAQADDPGAGHAAPPRRAERDLREHYPDLAVFWDDVAGRVPRGDRAHRRRRVHLSAARRRELLLPLRSHRARRPAARAATTPPHCPAPTRRRSTRRFAGRPAGMTVTMHTCRGNFRSTWLASGGYEDAVVEAMFSTDVDAYFMEWDSERAGGFEPLRLLPRGKTVVLGLVTTKSGALEPRTALARRIDEAARHVPLDRLCLSPQCGFASTHHGNTLTEDEQWRKLERVVEVAREVWGA